MFPSVLAQQTSLDKFGPGDGSFTFGLRSDYGTVFPVSIDATVKPPVQRGLGTRRRRAASASENISRSRTVVFINCSFALPADTVARPKVAGKRVALIPPAAGPTTNCWQIGESAGEGSCDCQQFSLRRPRSAGQKGSEWRQCTTGSTP